MEELFNSPPRAELTPKAAKGARNSLSGAGRKRLKHYKAKGLPIEQALAMAKQPLPNPRKRPKAGDSLKRGRSANTTPENNMPKRGSVKPGAGATPASVPELKAASADQQAEQPPISRPAARTEPREHPSYSAVTSAEKFAVIPSGYPKALLSTKELSAVQEAILDVIRTQRQGAVKPFFTGCTFRPGWLLISCANRETADWLKAAMPKLKLWPGAKFITEDLVAVWAKVLTVCGEQEAVIASTYFPGESNDAPPREESPLPILKGKEACLGALRLQGVANLKSGDLIGHLKVLESFFTSPIVHLSDVQLPSLVFKRNFTVSIYDRSSWNNPNLCIPSDGSKLENGDTGAGVYGPRFRRSLTQNAWGNYLHLIG
ncbi:hypothetical protein ACLKA6_002571 [Drosophila palustris]